MANKKRSQICGWDWDQVINAGYSAWFDVLEKVATEQSGAKAATFDKKLFKLIKVICGSYLEVDPTAPIIGRQH